jgi:predicted nucleic acid-binding protein
MGLILDSSVLIAAERRGQNAWQALTSLSSQIGITDIAISVVTLIELAHGAVRADTPERKSVRQRFLQELQSAVPIYPVTIAMALRAGQLDGENTANGISSGTRGFTHWRYGIGAWIWSGNFQPAALSPHSAPECHDHLKPLTTENGLLPCPPSLI